MAVSRVEENTEVTVDPETLMEEVAVAVTPQVPTQDSPSVLDKLKGKYIRCLEPGHHWNQWKARIPPALEQTSSGGAQGQNNGRETR